MNEHPLATLQKLDPELMTHLQTADPLIYADGALPKKFKLLVAMAFDAAAGAEGGVRARPAQRCAKAQPWRKSPKCCAWHTT